MAKLRISVWMIIAFLGFSIALQAIVLLV